MTVPHNNLSDNFNSAELRQQIVQWATELGFNATGFTRASIGHHEQRLLNWLDNNFHGDMEYMQRHADLRRKPADLHHGTISVISVRMNYLPPQTTDEWSVLEEPTLAYVSRYALGRDYHKLMRKRLQSLAGFIEKHVGPFGYRAFVDSAPVMEKALAEQAGLGWIGKHSNLLSRDAGSWFFLGELYTDLPLHTTPQKTDSTADNHCGSCSACIDICPTQAIVEPYVVDARRCVSYLTIELRTSIPTELRHLIGNRIYGCDDCQLVCPWNKYLQHTCEKDFSPRHDLDCASLIELFNWSEAEFNERTLGSAIRRIGYDCWQRNIAVAMGNAPYNEQLVQALHARLPSATEMVQEHIQWALDQHAGKQ